MTLRILFCSVGTMKFYDGMSNDTLKYGGSYNENHIGHEIYNFSNYSGRYYGYVQNTSDTIEVDRLLGNTKGKYSSVDDVLVVWCAKRLDTAGIYVVGWYRNATVYRKLHEVPFDVMKHRNDKSKYLFNIYSENAVLVPTNYRNHRVIGIGEAGVWYGNEKENMSVLNYINDYENNRNSCIESISCGIENLTGYEKEVVTKARINQGKFRELLINKYKTCCLCGVSHKDLLVASHIKPWSISDENEKVNEFNGLLLCANHDKLFDKGLITFDDNGRIIISSQIDKFNRIFTNIDDNMKIKLEDESLRFMKYHRDNIFKK